MATDADADREVVEEDQLVTRERSRIVRRLTRRRQRQRVADRSHRYPRRAATIGFPTTECPRARQLQRVGTLQLRALDDVVDRRESIPASRCLQRVERFLATPTNVPPANP